MKILCDINLPLAESLFSRLGDVQMIEGRSLTPEMVHDADLLMIRSTAKMNESLLAGSSVKMIGSGVIGTDHLDQAYLAQAGIPWVNAPGCNAQSVADYWTTAILQLGQVRGITWAGKTVGIIGMGNVGQAVNCRAQALGMTVIGCDPFIPGQGYVDIDTLLPQCDIITLHTPLTHDGPHPTYHLFAGPRVRKVKPGAVLVNMARGPILESEIVCAAIDHGFLSDAIIDCWEGEPDWSANLASHAFRTTPHVAGHAYEGRINGTIAIYRAACEFVGVPTGEIPPLPAAPCAEITCDAANYPTDQALLCDITSQVCDIAGDDRRFRAAYTDDPASRRKNFDTLRKTYPLRRLFAASTILLKNATPTLIKTINALGFNCIA